MKQRLLNVLVALDQLAYVLLTLGAGYPDETLSAAAWRTEQAGKLGGRIFRPLIDLFSDQSSASTAAMPTRPSAWGANYPRSTERENSHRRHEPCSF